MAIAFIDNVAAGSAAGSTITTGAINTTGANLLVAFIGNYDSIASPTMSDSKGNTWTPLTALGVTQAIALRGFWCVPSSVGSGHTFTSTGANTYSSISVMAFSGAHATPFDDENGATGNPIPITQPGSITPSEDNCLVVAAAGEDTVTAFSLDGGFTIPNGTTSASVNSESGVRDGVSCAYLIQTSAAAANPTWTNTGSVRNALSITSFKAAAGGGIAIPVFTRQYRQRWS